MEYRAVLCALNAKYIHSSLAPWCLLAGVQAHALPQVHAVVVEGTINEPQDNVLARILAQDPHAVGLSCYLWNIRQTLTLARALKRHNPDVYIVLGGPEVSYNASAVLAEHACIDAVLCGEGEESLPALLNCLASGATPDPATQEIPGLCTRTGETPPCVLAHDPPSPYTPAYLEALHGRIAYLETSRGCPYRCAFCLSGRCGAPRWFSLKDAKQNLLTLARSGARTVKLIDRTFNANAAHANELLAFLLAHCGKEIPPDVCFHFEIAADILQEDTFALLAQAPAGMFQLEIGMQSFHAPTLRAVRRVTDVDRLQANVRRLVALGNMHIHIDLIAGLPQEDFSTFAQSFDTGYALGAQMLQLGFLKLLHGAPMREETDVFPCDFSADPPYEVTQTPWLSARELDMLHGIEDALERVYNAGRFRETAAYVLQATKLTPFAFYSALGTAMPAETTAGMSLDDYTAQLQRACAALPGVHKEALRDAMVRDRLATNATGRLPACLHVQDPALGQAVKLLANDAQTAPPAGVRRGVALLYGAKQICWADYENAHPVTGRYPLHTRPFFD